MEFTTRSLCRHSKEKPGALATSSALQQASPKLKQIYHSYYTTHPKEFIELLHFMQSGVTLKEIESSINQLRNIHPSHVTTEKIKLLCAKQKEEQTPVLTYSSQKQLILNTIQKTLTNVRSDVSNKIHSLRRRSMIQSKQMWVEKIDTLSKELKLPKIRQDFEEIIKESIQIDASYEEFLAQLLQTELDARQESAKYNRIRRADFPYKKYLEDLSLIIYHKMHKKLKLLKIWISLKKEEM